MSKKAKIWIVIGSSLIIITIVTFFSFYTYNYLNSVIPKPSISSKLKKYSHSTNIIYSDYGNVYYDNELYEYENDILWIDDNHLVYQKDNKYYYVDNDNTKELFLEDINNINHGSLFLKDNEIYFRYLETYYFYNVINDTLSTISKEDYYLAKDGNRYLVTAKEEDITTLTIKDSETNTTKEITNETLKENKLLKSINKISKIRFFNYSIWEDTIYLHLYAKEYSIVVTYDFDTGKIDYYDWFYREESRTCYLAYKISNKDNIPILKEIIK
ncbi:MAG: hypothetical protein IJM36_02710 [Acholeplasmatales bacterium]|nr:hypothetical protein [Acholeplasmatales bacterium]